MGTLPFDLAHHHSIVAHGKESTCQSKMGNCTVCVLKYNYHAQLQYIHVAKIIQDC